MPCPYFLPLHRLDRGAWIQPPRLPLGDAYAGECHADPAAPHEPPELHQRERCNCGYARQRCVHFPEDAAGDAVRFSILADSGGRVELVYVVEKDHTPVEHGRLVYVFDNDQWEGQRTTELLIRQARAFLENHRRRPL